MSAFLKRGTLTRAELIALSEHALVEARMKGIEIKVIPRGVSGGDDIEYKNALAGQSKRARELRKKRSTREKNNRGNRGAIMAKRAQQKIAITLST